MKKKIIIQSESTDASTDDVIAWLNYYGQLNKTIVFLGNSPISKFNFNYTGNGITIIINGENFTPEDSYWFRRGYFLFRYIDDIPTLAQETNRSIKEHLTNEGKTLERFLYYHLGKDRRATCPWRSAAPTAAKRVSCPTRRRLRN